MRVIRLGKEQFPYLQDVHEYFQKDLWEENKGKFRIWKTAGTSAPKIGKEGLTKGDLLIFTYDGHLVCTAYSDSERLDNTEDFPGVDLAEYPFYFMVNRLTLRFIEHRSVAWFSEELRKLSDHKLLLNNSASWPILSDRFRVQVADLLKGLEIDLQENAHE